MPKSTLRASLFTATALTGALFSQPAFADCISQAPVNPNVVNCTAMGTTGFDGTAINGMVVTVASGATVTTSTGGAALINTGIGSVVTNYAGDFGADDFGYAINAGSLSANAISMGGGSTFNNVANSTIQGEIIFGNATGTAVNTINNFWSIGASTTANLEGDITSAGNTVINNQAFIAYHYFSHITQTGLGTVTINNGVTGGYDSTGASIIGYANAVMWADITTAGSTTFNNALGAGLYYDSAGYTLGTNRTGTTTVNNLGAIEGPLTTADNVNVITNGSSAYIAGDITMTGTTNTLDNQYDLFDGGDLIGRIDGTISATGNLTLSNQGQIGADVFSDVIQTGAGTVLIDNGINGGYAFANGFTQNATITTNEFGLSTEGSTALVNHGGGNEFGAQISGNVELGTLGLGTSTIINGTQAFGAASIFGDVIMGDRTNTITNDGFITGDVTMNGTGANTYNAGTLESSGDNGYRLPGVDFSDGPGVTGVTGTLTGLAANSANNTLNLNGTGASNLTAGSNVLNFGTVNKNDSGAWFLNNTLDGNAGSLTALNINDGALISYGANFVGNGNTTIKMAQDTYLRWENTTGTFNGNIVSAAGADSGVEIYASNLTLGGNNTFTGYLDINGSVVSTTSNGAFSANADLYIYNDSDVTANNNVTINNLYDDGAEGGNYLNLNGANTSLTLNGGDWGNFQGFAQGDGRLIKISTGTLDLYGTDTVNLVNGGSLVINNGSVSVHSVGAISASTAVVVNSGATTTGSLDLFSSDSIGSLAGTGANAVVSLTNAILRTGNDNTSTTYAGKLTGNGGLIKLGTGNMTLTGLSTYTGTTSVDLGTLTGFAGTTASNGSLQGNITVGADGALVFNQRLSPLGNTSGTYTGQLTGAGSVSVDGNGTGVLTLTGDNTGFTGPMYLKSGAIVSVASQTNLGTGTLELTDAMLLSTGNTLLGNTITLNLPSNGTPSIGRPGGTFQVAAGTTLDLEGDISGAGGLTKTGTGTLKLYGSNTYTGGTLVSAGILEAGAGYGLQGDVINNAQVNLTGLFDIYDGNMSGTGNVTVFGNAIVGFEGNNTYTGNTLILSGSNLFSFSNTALANLSAFTVNGVLTSQTESNTIGSLAGSGSVIAQDLSIGANNTSTTFSGRFTDDGGQFFTQNIRKIGTGTLTLTGAGSAMEGTLAVNGGTLALASTATVAAGNTAVTSGAILSVDGILTSPTVLISLGGRLVGGLGVAPGRITGAVTNNGTVAPGHSPGIIAINGSYVQGSTGTYAAEVNGNGTTTVVAGVDYDRIAVTGTPGTASLAGTLAITQNGSTYVTGAVYDIITTTGGITGSFTTVTGNTISAFQSLSNVVATGGGIQGNNYRLAVVRSSAYRTAAANPNQVAVANGLTGIIGSAGAAAITNKIDSMNTAQAQALFQGLNPEPYAAYATALQDQGELFTRQVGQRLAETGASDKATGLWMNGYGQWANGKSRDYRFGSDHKITGGAIGIDFGTEALRVGVAGGYSEDDVTYLGANSTGTNKSWQVGGYIGYGAGPLHLNAQAAYISGNITATKLVAAGSGATLIQGTAAADTDGHLFKGVVTVGYNLGSGSLTFEPFVGVDFASGHVNGFTETGMGTLNLTVADIEAKRTDLVVGARFAASTGSVRPYANVTYRYNLDDNPSVVTGYFNGVSAAPFTVSAIGSGRSAVDVDAGISARISSSATVFVGYHGTFRGDLDSHGVNGGLRFSF